MPTLQEEFQSTLNEFDALSAKGTERTAEETTKWLGLLEKGEGLKAQLVAEQKATELKDWGRGSAGMIPVVGDKQHGPGTHVASEPAGKSVIERSAGGLEMVLDEGPQFGGVKMAQVTGSDDYKSAFRTYLRKGERGLVGAEVKTLQEGVDDAGGFLVPLDFLNRIISRVPTPTRVAGRVTTFQTGRDKIAIPIVKYTTDDNYTTGMRVTWTGEVPATSTTQRVTEPVFGQVSVPIHTAMMSMPLTLDVVEDAMFPLVNWASDKFAETVGVFKDDFILNGNGVGKPEGILLNPGATDQPAIVNWGNPLTADGVQGVPWVLPEQYEDNATWVFNKTSTGKAIGALKDGNNRYLWSNFDNNLQDGYGAGGFRRPLIGYPVTFSGLMPNQGANNFSGIFGDLAGYYLVNRVGFSIQVLRELYAETNQILLLGRLRVGGLTAEPWRLKIAKNA